MRAATPDDFAAFLRMGRAFAERAGVDYNDESLAETFRILVETDSLFMEGDPPHGMVAVMAYENYFKRGEMVAQELFWWVDPEHRGGGIGTRMLEGVETWAASQGARSLTMVALDEVDGEKVGRLYAARGYRPLERHFRKVLNDGN